METEPTGDEVRAAWDALAGYWDERMEAGETWQRHLIQPCVEGLLALEPGERVLEIACGNGEFARRMAGLGASVLAVDFSEGMLEQARAHGGGVEYRSVDATHEDELTALGAEGSFDVVVSNMAIMDMASIEPMASASARLLRPGGRFVFSTLHPAFNSGDAVPTVELIYRDGDVANVHSVKVSSYSQVRSMKGIAIEGQPVEQWYFHRPLAEILRPFFAHGFTLDALEEPLVDAEHGSSPGSPADVYTDLPGVLVARMRSAD
jgi:2-polyprenyl-3-methyl-5-hydroxy-6-metoxy-1,4-benzoquinol methylase